MSFNSKYTGAQVEELLGKIPTANNIWHTGNDGSGSGLDADLLDGLHNGELTALVLSKYSDTWDYSLGNPGLSVFSDWNNTQNLADYFYGINIESVSKKFRTVLATPLWENGLYWRRYSDGDWQEDWRCLIDSYNIDSYNAGSATKLQTARTIWGQSFDGTRNIDGNMVLKGSYVEIILQGTNSYNTGISFNDYEGNPRWYLSYRGLNAADKDFYIYRYTDDNSYHVAMSLIRSNGNVGIGTTNPTTKLDVTGNIHSSGGITQDSDINLKNKIKDVLLSINEIAEAPLFEFTYKSDKDERIHVGTSAQYWIEKNNWFCKKQDNGYYDMEIQNLALASAISIAKEFKKYKEETESTISSMKKEIEELKQIILNMNK